MIQNWFLNSDKGILNGMNDVDHFSSSGVSDSQYISQGGELRLSNPGQGELLLAMAESGAALRTAVRGFSMQPFIRDKDILTILPIKDMQPSLGDVVAFTWQDTGRLAIHRIIGRKDNGWLIKGDNCPEPDGVVAAESIIGRVCRVERQGKEVHLGIGKAGKLIAILNRGKALFCLKQIVMLSQSMAGRALQSFQSLAIYRYLGKKFLSQVIISMANEDDMESVHCLFSPVVPYRRQNPNPNVINWIAKRKGKIIGFTQNVYQSIENDPWYGHWLFSLHVRVRYRGVGIGEKLMTCSVDKAKEQGAAEILLAVFEDNPKAFCLYRKLGFDHITKTVLEPLLSEEKAATGRRRIVMRKKLK
jgi:ribosomal protein S18 acetylase RimI-like enzyme